MSDEAKPRLQDVARVEGPSLALRLVQPEDALYVHGLRTDPALNRYLSKVAGGVEDQRLWIEAYKVRESAGQELYYVIERLDGVRCGTVRLYNFTPNDFTWGSWILDASKPPRAALESAVLSFGIGFHDLGLGVANVDVQVDNTHAISFYRRFGMTEVDRTAEEIFFRYTNSSFAIDRARHMAILEKGPRQ